nr:hypothetical protein [Burkholderia pseudomallei]
MRRMRRVRRVCGGRIVASKRATHAMARDKLAIPIEFRFDQLSAPPEGPPRRTLPSSSPIAPNRPTSISSARALPRTVERAGVIDERALVVFARDPRTGALLGGLTGSTSLGLRFVDVFYLTDALRGDGVGARSRGLPGTRRASAVAARPCCTRSASRRPRSTRSSAGDVSATCGAIRAARIACS